MAKTHLIKVYDKEGARLIDTWTDASFEGYSWTINGGLGQLDIQLARNIRQFGEGNDVAVGNVVTIDVHDRETTPEGKRIYSGFIYEYEQSIFGNDISLVVRCIGNQSRFASRMLESGSDTTVTYTSQDPADMFKDVISKANVGGITTTSASVDNVGSTFTITFKGQTIQEVLDKVVELAGYEYYWYVDASNVAHMHKVDTRRIDHNLVYGKHFSSISSVKSIQDLVNEVFFIGGGDPNLYKKYTRSGSEDSWGSYQKRLIDQRVSVAATAERFSATELNIGDHPKTKLIFTLADSNIQGEKGFDIESLEPGQLIAIDNITDREETLWDRGLWDDDYWDFDITTALSQPQIIRRIDYRLGQATIEVGEAKDHIANELLNIMRRVDVDQLTTIPDTPS